jgi:hypothetical protein
MAPDLRHLLLRRNVNARILPKSGSSPFHNEMRGLY